MTYDVTGHGYYMLDKKGEVIPCNDLEQWGRFMQIGAGDPKKCPRVLRVNNLIIKGERIMVSTVFLAQDCGSTNQTPILWETMVFGGEHDQKMFRYAAKEEALKGHKKMINFVKK
jgi:hypothetical protein